MLTNLPSWIRVAILLGCGAIIGSMINWAIYAWAMFLKRPISPWMKPAEGESERTLLDRIPIIGWIGRRRDSEVYGKGFWIRPMLIEVACAIGVPWFYQWLAAGGLTAGNIPATGWPLMYETWFFAFGMLLTLMCIGTFIDFDEKTIPDEVTVTGTVIALLFAAFAPLYRLPQEPLFGMAKAPTIEPIHYASPGDLPGWHLGTMAMVTAMLIFAAWIGALLPKFSPFYVGLRKSIRLSMAHAFRPKRKTKCDIRVRSRTTPRVTVFLITMLLVGLAGIYMAWNWLPPPNLESLYSSLIGLAFGGGLVWAIRIIGTVALQKEAMGFGDVTLHAMIGAFLGWQAALLVFVIAPFAALLIVLIQFILIRQNVIAFGPYLCAGAVILLYSWHWVRPSAAAGVFALGPFLLVIVAGCLVLMALMLGALSWFKGLFMEEELVDENVN